MRSANLYGLYVEIVILCSQFLRTLYHYITSLLEKSVLGHSVLFNITGIGSTNMGTYLCYQIIPNNTKLYNTGHRGDYDPKNVSSI